MREREREKEREVDAHLSHPPASQRPRVACYISDDPSSIFAFPFLKMLEMKIFETLDRPNFSHLPLNVRNLGSPNSRLPAVAVWRLVRGELRSECDVGSCSSAQRARF